jgi:GntR family transcriptional regulator
VRRTRRPSLVDEVRQELLDELAGGTLPHGAKLPSESDLAQRFAVSRATVREAVLGLLDAGLLVRRQGSGTYVTTAPRVNHALDTTVSYTAMIRETGQDPGEIMLSSTRREATAHERAQLDLERPAGVTEVERVRLAGARRVIYSRDRIPSALLERVADDELRASLYVVLDWAGHAVERATARLTPTVADGPVGAHLEVRRGTPLLRIEQTDYDRAGRAVMLSDEWHVADAFTLVVNRRSRASSDDP